MSRSPPHRAPPHLEFAKPWKRDRIAELEAELEREREVRGKLVRLSGRRIADAEGRGRGLAGDVARLTAELAASTSGAGEARDHIAFLESENEAQEAVLVGLRDQLDKAGDKAGDLEGQMSVQADEIRAQREQLAGRERWEDQWQKRIMDAESAAEVALGELSATEETLRLAQLRLASNVEEQRYGDKRHRHRERKLEIALDRAEEACEQTSGQLRSAVKEKHKVESALSLQQLASCQPRRLCTRLAELRQRGETAEPEWETIMEALQVNRLLVKRLPFYWYQEVRRKKE